MLLPTKPWHSKIVCRRCRLSLPDEYKPVARPDLAAESDVLHAAERDESLRVKLDGAAKVAGKLGGGLAHEYARQQRIIRHVAADPEFVGGDVLVADDQLVLEIDADDRRELLHLEPLGVGRRIPSWSARIFDVSMDSGSTSGAGGMRDVLSRCGRRHEAAAEPVRRGRRGVSVAADPAPGRVGGLARIG